MIVSYWPDWVDYELNLLCIDFVKLCSFSEEQKHTNDKLIIEVKKASLTESTALVHVQSKEVKTAVKFYICLVEKTQ